MQLTELSFHGATVMAFQSSKENVFLELDGASYLGKVSTGRDAELLLSYRPDAGVPNLESLEIEMLQAITEPASRRMVLGLEGKLLVVSLRRTRRCPEIGTT